MKHRSAFQRSSLWAGVLGFWVLSSFASHATDVVNYGVVKGQAFSQTSAAAPTSQGYAFQIFVDSACDQGVTNATVRLANGSVLNLMSDGNSWEFGAEFAGQAALDADYPNGTNRLNIYTLNDGAKTNLSLIVTGNVYPATTPRISNYSAAQSVNASNSFPLTWDAFSGGTTNDYIQLQINDTNDNTVFESARYGASDALNGTNNSFTIPANALSPGQSYQGTLLFARGVGNFSGYPGVAGVGAYFKRTTFGVQTIGMPETDPPFLVEPNPHDGETNVPVNSPIAFTFSEPMRPDFSIEWSPDVEACKFTKTWTADRQTLVCVYETNLPSNETISWTLNPSFGNGSFRDPAGNNLSPSPVSGSFTTGTKVNAHDVTFYVVFKRQRFLQTNSSAAVLGGNTPFHFGADVVSPSPFSVTAATVQPPSGPAEFLTTEGNETSGQKKYSDKPSLDLAFPSGNYVLTLTTAHERTHTVTNNLSGDAYPSTAPHVSDFNAAQAINPGAPFVLTWDKFTSGTVTDFVQLLIEDDVGNTVFETPGIPVLQGALNGTNTSALIPAGTFAAGQMYQAALLFAKVSAVYTNDYPGAIGASAYIKETDFFVTAKNAALPPSLSNVARVSAGQIQFLLTGETGQHYTLQMSTNLGTTNWTTLFVTNAPGNSFLIKDGGATNALRFYRVLVGP